MQRTTLAPGASTAKSTTMTSGARVNSIDIPARSSLKAGISSTKNMGMRNGGPKQNIVVQTIAQEVSIALAITIDKASAISLSAEHVPGGAHFII